MLSSWIAGPNPVDGFEAVDPGHHQVDQHHVGQQPGGIRDRRRPGAGLADHLEARPCLQKEAQPLAHDLMVVDHEEGGPERASPHWGHRRSHRRTVPGGRDDLEAATDRLDPFPHGDQAQARREATTGPPGSEPDPVVDHRGATVLPPGPSPSAETVTVTADASACRRALDSASSATRHSSPLKGFARRRRPRGTGVGHRHRHRMGPAQQLGVLPQGTDEAVGLSRPEGAARRSACAARRAPNRPDPGPGG